MNIGRFILRISFFILVPLLIALITYRFLHRAFLAPYDVAKKNIVLLEVATGLTVKSICKDLQQKGVLRHWWSLWFLHRMSDKDSKIQSGEYEVSAAMPPKDILHKLLGGQMFKRTVIVLEGSTVDEVANVVEKAGLITNGEFQNGARNRALLAAANIKSDSFEGYLFPATYFYSRPIAARDVIWRMLEEGDKRWPPAFTDQADKLNLSRHEILTLASIIEKESPKFEEQPIISSIFHNRLSKGMKLQSDPTVTYGLKDSTAPVTPEDRDAPHPYNTFTNYGLPPGPICNPGETAIRAALFPKETTYLYFLTRPDGSHVFSTTFQEHQTALDMVVRGPGAAVVIAPIVPSPIPTVEPSPAPTGRAVITLSPRQRR